MVSCFRAAMECDAPPFEAIDVVLRLFGIAFDRIFTVFVAVASLFERISSAFDRFESPFDPFEGAFEPFPKKIRSQINLLIQSLAEVLGSAAGNCSLFPRRSTSF